MALSAAEAVEHHGRLARRKGDARRVALAAAVVAIVVAAETDDARAPQLRRLAAEPGHQASDRLGVGPIRRLSDMPAGGERLIADAPTGYTHTLVNGVPTRLDGTPVAGARPGAILRSRPDQ